MEKRLAPVCPEQNPYRACSALTLPSFCSGKGDPVFRICFFSDSIGHREEAQGHF